MEPLTNFADLFTTSLEYTIETQRGPAVLKLRPLNADNTVYVAEVLEEERRKAAGLDVTPPPAEALAITPESLNAERIKGAANIHRWCLESATFGGVTLDAAGSLAFLTALAVHKQTVFRELVAFLAEGGASEEAAPEALAGESPAG